VADTAIDVLRSILSYFDADDAGIDEYEGDEGEIQLDVVGDDMAVLIGRHGRTLDALQYTVVSATNKRLGFRYPIVIDVEGYKYRRRQKIEGLARSAASKASNQGKNIRLRPMTSYERRIVHLALRDDRRVTTVSEGEEPNRRVVVKPQR
jgi:spoIIIJ-associated protein